MNKLILILVAVFSFVSCDLVTYTVENKHSEAVQVTGKNLSKVLEIQPGECVEFLDVFGVFGDFPLEFSVGTRELSGDKSYDSGNYAIEGLRVVEVSDEKACLPGQNAKTEITPDRLPGAVDKSPVKPEETPSSSPSAVGTSPLKPNENSKPSTPSRQEEQTPDSGFEEQTPDSGFEEQTQDSGFEETSDSGSKGGVFTGDGFGSSP